MEGNNTYTLFLSSVSKYIQHICKESLSFDTSVLVTGHLWVNIDTKDNFGLVVSEKVNKIEGGKTTVLSSSFPNIEHKTESNLAEVTNNRTAEMGRNNINDTQSFNSSVFPERQGLPLLEANLLKRTFEETNDFLDVQPPLDVSFIKGEVEMLQQGSAEMTDGPSCSTAVVPSSCGLSRGGSMRITPAMGVAQSAEIHLDP